MYVCLCVNVCVYISFLYFLSIVVYYIYRKRFLMCVCGCVYFCVCVYRSLTSFTRVFNTSGLTRNSTLKFYQWSSNPSHFLLFPSLSLFIFLRHSMAYGTNRFQLNVIEYRNPVKRKVPVLYDSWRTIYTCCFMYVYNLSTQPLPVKEEREPHVLESQTSLKTKTWGNRGRTYPTAPHPHPQPNIYFSL